MSIKDDILSAEKLAREVVLKRVAIIAAVAVVLQVLVSMGWIPVDLTPHITEWVNRVIDMIAVISGALYVRQGVTPADPSLDPISANGLPLVEQGARSASANKPTMDDWFPAGNSELDALVKPEDAVFAPEEGTTGADA